MSAEQTDSSEKIKSLHLLLASGFYSGYAPIAPGTCGTVVAMLLACVGYNLYPPMANKMPVLCLAVLVTAFGIYSCNYLLGANHFGEDEKDPSQIVIDEFAGYFVSLLGVGSSLAHLLLAFVLFRIFDISKLPPVKQLERLPRGYGIMLDDVAAGVYAALCGYVLSGLLAL